MEKALNYLLVGIIVLAGFDTIWASVQADIEKANKKDKTVFLVVTEPGVAGVENAVSVAKQASEKVGQSTVIEMNRADSNNNQLVSKYRLAGTRLPLILTIATNGAAAGGLPAAQATPENLVNMIPSPTKADVLQALSERKAVFVVASRKSMVDRSKVIESSKAACSQMKNKAAFISIDMDDENENSFLSQLKINKLSTMPITAVINSQGKITGSFNGSVEVEQLVQAATKNPKGCCPDGSKKGCKVPQRKAK